MKKIEIDDFAKAKYISSPKFSPNGKNACFVVSNANMEKNGYDSYIYCIKDGVTFKLTSGGNESVFFYLDDNNVAFISDRKDSSAKGSKIYSINVNGGEANLVCDFPIAVMDIKKLKNNDFLVVGSFDPHYPDLYKNNEKYIKEKEKNEKENADYEVIEENPWWHNGGTFTKSVKSALYYYSSKKKKLSLITDPSVSVFGLKISTDQKQIYFSGNTTKGFFDFTKTDLYTFDLKTKEYKVIIKHEDLSVHDVEFVGDKVILVANKFEFGMNTNPDFYCMDPEDYSFDLYMKYGQSIGSSVGSDVRYGGGQSIKAYNDCLYFTTTKVDCSYLYQLRDGKIRCVIDKKGSIDSFDVYEDKLLFVGLYDMLPQELYNESLNKITNFNDSFKEKYIAIPDEFNFKGKVDELKGFVLKPFDYDESKKYPVIIDIHGGPKTVTGPVFYHEMQYWASKGYFVVYTNPTGSDGRGNEFADIRGKYGTVDYDDLMIFCDEVIKRYPAIDSTKFFETGGSYGGFMTNWIIGHTDRFKACASQRSIANWLSFYGISDIGIGFASDQNAANPFDNPEKMWWHSPMKYAANVKTPTLFIHSECDYRCPMPEGMQMFSSLLAHDVETKMIYFKGENHDLSRSGKPKHRIKRLEEITKWFDEHMN